MAVILLGKSANAKMHSPPQQMQIVGQATLSVLFWDIYHATLYSTNGRYQLGSYPVALNIQYLRNIKAQDLIKRTAEEWDKLGYPSEQYLPWLQQLKQIWPDILKGDELTLYLASAEHSDFYFNGERIGSLQAQNFGTQFLAIWLDEKCSFPKLRKQLLGISK